MEDEHLKPSRKGLLYRFDGLIKKIIPNFNVRAILYLSIAFGVAIYIQIWRISSAPTHPSITQSQVEKETVVADQSYWDSAAYQDKIKHQTVDSFTTELGRWLSGTDQEFAKRTFQDILFINAGLSADTGGDLAQVVPENFNYLENIGRARYQYAKDRGFLSDTPTLVKIGTLVCNLDKKTEQVTGIELYDWRYASMQKLATFMKTKPDWKVQVGNRILDVSDSRVEDKDLLKLKTAETQPTGLFSFLIFHDPKTNRIVLADSAMLENSGVDAALTLSRIDTHFDKQPKLYFMHGYAGCNDMNLSPHIDYGQSD